MGALRSDRIWLFGGLALIALLVVSGWFLMINPKYAEASDVRSQAEDTTTQLSKLKKQLADLKADNANLPDYKATLDTYNKALPTSDSIPAFLRQLQSMGTELHVDVNAYTASGRSTSKAVATVEELSIALSATGEVDNISKLVKQLQNTQPRAALINSATLTVNGVKADGFAGSELSLALTVFRNVATTTTAVTTTN
ncbi:type 4a pilus biogenesis protein PilO [Actinoplanes awajinensis]|uniref:Pilus assembly protein PilO n=1 Tax=Actinoplanes awajinensis subsp. mycoplanecinus TaxID=135947 RepID=A0A0X3UW40_9ACTN|nr:type 4a pilus biogenesis protein PilO [Actinoplanes awajinensis]KUL36749.1 hypothetical protein ADL15_13055 [Actinoplanes awajinensis subsp. mycoplanecinus]